jgi:two-component system sensor histidine kinase/response regulator
VTRRDAEDADHRDDGARACGATGERCLEDAGMDGYIAKPITAAALFAELREVLPDAFDMEDMPEEETARETASSGGEVFDRSAALDRLDGDEELLNELVSIFLEEYPEERSTMRRALNTEDWRTLERTAHALHGAMSNFCPEPVCETVRALEDAAQGEDPDEAKTALRRVERAIEALRTAMMRHGRGAGL